MWGTGRQTDECFFFSVFLSSRSSLTRSLARCSRHSAWTTRRWRRFCSRMRETLSAWSRARSTNRLPRRRRRAERTGSNCNGNSSSGTKTCGNCWMWPTRWPPRRSKTSRCGKWKGFKFSAKNCRIVVETLFVVPDRFQYINFSMIQSYAIFQPVNT